MSSPLDWVEPLLGAGNLPWALLALAVSTFLTEDLTCVAAGVLVSAGKLEFVDATAACFFGIWVGDLLLVGAGRVLGRGALQCWPLKGRVSNAELARAERWFEKHGAWVVLASRFMPGTRLPTYLAVGALRVSWLKFAGRFGFACAVWTPLLVGAAWVAGETVSRWEATLGDVWWCTLGAGGAVWLSARAIVRLATWRERRLLLGSWRRLSRWEFWPTWVLYTPVVVYGLWLAVRYRGLTVFTAANPGIGAAGGLVGESKSEILSGLAGAGERVAEWILVAPGEAGNRTGQVLEFVACYGWPVVLKPDVGERGAGVVIARSDEEVWTALSAEPRAVIAQRYIAGVEFGVFYVRRPGESVGRILAITEKHMPVVVGDGESSLERLILSDDRAVCMGRFFLAKFAGRLDEVPERGVEFPLTELGTHSRGALFLDGGNLCTPRLAEEIDRVSRALAGFYIGRYDIRSESVGAFQRGSFRVIELNGVSAEATSMYDPRYGVGRAWRMLCAQWGLAYEIGASNRTCGHRVWSTKDVAMLWLYSRRDRPSRRSSGERACRCPSRSGESAVNRM